ncbi:MAG: hypothetical protein ACE5MM_10475 [Nitrospiraceae bacterium]
MNRIGPTALLECSLLSCMPASAGVTPVQIDLVSPDDSAQAENAPLFASHDAIQLTLEGNLTALRSDRSEEPDEQPAQLAFRDINGSPVAVPVGIRPRGGWRRQKRNCDFPNYWLNLPKQQVENTLFDGQDELPVVTPCRVNQKDYQAYVLQEYLAYRIYNVLTQSSFRVRLAQMTYIDAAAQGDTLTKYVFLVEHADQLASRHRMTVLDVRARQDDVDPDRLWPMLLFQYMIGNTDWSVSGLHNIMLLADQEQIPLPVPFDFDWTGIVNPRYAAPDPSLNLKRITDRLWRGHCKPEEAARAQLAVAFALLSKHKDEIYALYLNQPRLDRIRLEETYDYLDEFYETINHPDRVRREFIQTCRR